MHTDLQNEIQQRYLNWSYDHSARLTAAQSQLLSLRSAGLALLADEILRGFGSDSAPIKGTSSALYDADWLSEFATGDFVKCLGQEFAIYRNRRSPRIPNGDLLLMSRIMAIEGIRGEFNQPARISAELDIPSNAWYFDGSVQGELPVSIMLEAALQPCGVLSAWLGTQLRFPAVDFFFRNLDGDAHFLRNIDFRGKTIRVNAELTKTVFSGSTIIQYFDFELSFGGDAFFKGWSSFGYFPEDSMASQIGIDSGMPTLPWGKDPANAHRNHVSLSEDALSFSDFPYGKLRLIDRAEICVSGGDHSNGYVFASRRNSPSDWFYTNHFYQDPVMPGSLGIEAIFQAFKAGVHFTNQSGAPVTLAPGSSFQWKYRGQILQHHQEMRLEVQIQDHQTINGIASATANASLWADDIRIYAVNNLQVQQDQGNNYDG